MQEAHISDFSSLNSRAILGRSNTVDVLRVGGFIVTTGGGIGCIVWGIASGRMTVAFSAMCLFVLVGLVMFIFQFMRVPIASVAEDGLMCTIAPRSEQTVGTQVTFMFVGNAMHMKFASTSSLTRTTRLWRIRGGNSQ